MSFVIDNAVVRKWFDTMIEELPEDAGFLRCVLEQIMQETYWQADKKELDQYARQFERMSVLRGYQ